MADISGTNLVAPVVPFTTEDSYPTHMAQYGKGGWRSVQTKAELATIPSQRLEVGMVAYVIEESTPYVYDGQDWKALIIEMDLSKVATEATLIAGIASIEEKIENKSVDLTSVAKDETLKSESQTIQSAIQNIDLSSVESKVDAVGAKIDNTLPDEVASLATTLEQYCPGEHPNLFKPDSIGVWYVFTGELVDGGGYKCRAVHNTTGVPNYISVHISTDGATATILQNGVETTESYPISKENIKTVSLTAILDAVGSIQLDKSDLAKQGENAEATNSKILEEVQNKLTPLEAVLTELNNGKAEMVDALKIKNVESSTNKTLSAIAKDIRSIAQEPITIEGGEMYEKQLFGAVTDKTLDYSQPNSPIWNLYQVMANLLNDGRFLTYGGILLAEYNKNISSIELNKAGSGGLYLTSDGAYYQNDVTHTWNDLSDIKVNRWVAYLFANDAKSFEITRTNNPLSIHVGRHLGRISLEENAELSSIVVTDGNKLDNFISKTYTTNLKGGTVLRNIGGTSGSLLYKYSGNKLCAIIDNLQSGKKLIDSLSSNCDVYIQAERLEGLIMAGDLSNKTVSLIVDCPYIFGTYTSGGIINQGGNFFVLKNVILITEYAVFNCWADYSTEKFSFFYKTNDKTKIVSLVSGTGSIKHNKCLDVELQEGWCKPLSVVMAPNLTEENMINHILKRLKQDEEMCGSGVTITLGATNLEKLTSEEAVALLDSLTNIYGYTFA